MSLLRKVERRPLPAKQPLEGTGSPRPATIAAAAPAASARSPWCEERGAYAVRFARNAADRRAVQALRYDVFARELGARVEGAEHGLDLDPLDERADHLMVLERATGACVGSYRLATAEQVGAPGFYTERLFQLDRLPSAVRREGVELGRACVALGHRNRGVLQLLLRGIGAHLVETGKRFVFGCGSVGLEGEGQARQALAEIASEDWLDPSLDVTPTPAYRPSYPASSSGSRPEIPALLYAYCAIGARLACAPA